MRGRVTPFALLLLAALAGCGEGRGGGSEPPTAVGTEPGDRAPPLTGRLASAEEYRLDPRSPTVIVFYRGGYCGLCRERLSGLQESLGAYDRLGARVVAVSADLPEALERTSAELGLAFPLVSADSAVLSRWGVLPDGAASSLPATYIVEEAGRVLFAHRGRNAADRMTDATLVTLLERREAAR